MVNNINHSTECTLADSVSSVSFRQEVSFLDVGDVRAIPETTRLAALGSFAGTGNMYLTLRDEYGPLFLREDFTDLYSWKGGEALPPEFLATVTVLQFAEGLSDRAAAACVRSRIDWKYLLGVEIDYSGFNYSVLSRFRSRLVENDAMERLFEKPLEQMRKLNLVKERGNQRTDSTHVLAQIRLLNRLELVGETMRRALNELCLIAPEWLSSWIPEEWYGRYGLRIEEYRLPQAKAKREAFLVTVGEDGYQILNAIHHLDAPSFLLDFEAVQALNLIWLQQYQLIEGECEPRQSGNLPFGQLMINSPYDIEARYSIKRNTTWTGYKVHITETCDPEQPRLVTHIQTSPATEPDCVALPLIHQALEQKELLPHIHLVDGGYISAENVTQSNHDMDIQLIGPARPDTSWQAKNPDAYDISCFDIDWQAQSVTCPQGINSRTWSPSVDKQGKPYITVRFQKQQCLPCPMRHLCTSSKEQPRSLKIQPSQELHLSIQLAREQAKSPQFQHLHKPRAGIEGTISQATRAFRLRSARFIGTLKTKLQHYASAAALNLSRLYLWASGATPEYSRISPLLEFKAYHNT